MEAKGSTWQGLQPSTCSRFLKKLEMRSKSFMAGPREGRGKLGGRASIHCPRQILLSKGMRRWESNMVGSEQRLVEVGNDGVHAGVVGWQQQGANRRRGQNRSRIGSSTVTENAAKAKAARLGGQGGLSTSKSGPKLVCFVHFDLEMCFAPQRRALFRHLNFQKWSEHGVLCTF